jgi:hypothetical protein
VKRVRQFHISLSHVTVNRFASLIFCFQNTLVPTRSFRLSSTSKAPQLRFQQSRLVRLWAPSFTRNSQLRSLPLISFALYSRIYQSRATLPIPNSSVMILVCHVNLRMFYNWENNPDSSSNLEKRSSTPNFARSKPSSIQICLNR